jgi:hypothetical protein
MTFCGFGGALAFAANAARPIKPDASADAASVRALRRVARCPIRQNSHMLSPIPVAGGEDFSWRAM